MYGGKPEKQRVVDFEEMVEISKRVILAAQAVTEAGDRCVGLDMLVVVNIHIRKPFVL